ncbi:hypothetical protein R3P38DRAFT_3445739 [Favolaschia claudopus]|uniref:Uncharacterized protein n=1 Tax=Favolaschia claudopus TaxID=2862362 RepID=A0AAV9ZNG1_9AGAR
MLKCTSKGDGKISESDRALSLIRTRYYSRQDVLAIIVLWDDVADIDERDRAAFRKIRKCERRLQAVEAVGKLPPTSLSFSDIITYDYLIRSILAEDVSYTSLPLLSKAAPIPQDSDRRTPSKVNPKEDAAIGRVLDERVQQSFSRLLSPIPPPNCLVSAVAAIPTLPAHRAGSILDDIPATSRHYSSSVTPSFASTAPSRAPTSTPTPPAPCTLPPSCPLRRPDPNSSPQPIASKLHDARGVPRLDSPSARAPRIPSSPAVAYSSTHTPPDPAAASPSLRAAALGESPALSAAVQLSTPPVNLPLPSVLTGVRKDSAMQQALPARRPAPVPSPAVGAPPPRLILHRLDVPSASPFAAGPIPANSAVLPVALPHHHLTPCRARVEKSPPRYRLSGHGHRIISPPPLSRCGSVEIRPTSPSLRKTGKDPPWRVDADPSNAARSRGGYVLLQYTLFEVAALPRESAATPPPLRGVNLLIDEVALEERACHFRHNNSVGGLCWRHSSKVDLQLKTYDDALKIAEKIKSGEVHLGKEMTVVSVSCFGESGTYPILALPTCKSVGPSESSIIYETVTEAWVEHAAAKVGMPWSWSTDGEASRRRAGYDNFVRYKLGPTSPLYGTLAGMAGLNIFTGLHSITLDFDYKHVFKRLYTLIRSAAGMALCNGRIINPAVLTQFLARLPDMSEDSVRNILFPDDPQDVPRAVELMEAVIDFLAFDFGQVDADTAADLDSIRLLALILKSILAPFVSPDMSLTEQMTHLSTYAHLTYTLFRLNRLTFMSNQLYGDSQSMVKNAFFCLAKQQKLDPRLPFYLFQVGDDPLERLFGKLRMLGAHNSAMSYAQAIERLGHACDLQAVFLRQPDMDQGQRRISMTRSEGVDHLNIVSWTGHAIAGDCHIPSVWEEGRKVAKQILAKLRFPQESYDYAMIFANPEIDMLRPFGDGKYPGVESDIDRSIVLSTPTSTATSATPPSSSLPFSSTPSPATSSSPSTLTPFATTALVSPSTSSSHSASISTITAASDAPSETAATPDPDDDMEDQSEGITFEETLDDVPELVLPSGRGIDPNDYISVEVKWVHKQRICRVVFNADFEPKSTERLKRVRGHTKVNSKKRDDVNPEALLGDNTFIVGDPFFILLRTDQILSLAVVRSTAIHEDGVSRGSILAPTIRNPQAKVKLSGQILSLTMVPTLDDNLPESDSALVQPRSAFALNSPSPGPTCEEKSPWSWIWNGRFLKVDSAIAGTKQTTEKVVIISVPGALTELVNHRPVDAVPRLGQRAYEINSEGRSWELDDGPMGAVCELLWDVVVKEKIALTSIASVKKSADFPYAFDNGLRI